MIDCSIFNDQNNQNTCFTMTEAKTRPENTPARERESKTTSETYPQAREWDAEGKKVRDVDFTDHNRPQNHPNPHQNKYDPKTGKRGPPEEI
jgi:hypothetical protein